MDQPLIHTAADLHVGQRAEFEREITAEDISAFAELSRDRNPLHVDAEYARHTNYEERIVHGAFQVGLVSAMAGMSGAAVERLSPLTPMPFSLPDFM